MRQKVEEEVEKGADSTENVVEFVSDSVDY